MSTSPAKSPSAATAGATGETACARAKDGALSSKVRTPRTRTVTCRMRLLPSSNGRQEYADRRLDRPTRGHLTPAPLDVNQPSTVLLRRVVMMNPTPGKGRHTRPQASFG